MSGRYSGDGSHWGSTGFTRVRVNRWNTSTKVTASPVSAKTGQAVKLSAVIISGGSLAPGGTVIFKDAVGDLCSARVSRNTASCAYTWKSAGTYPVTGTYSGDAAHNASSGMAKVTVSAAKPTVYATTTKITNPDPATTLAGKAIAIDVTVASPAGAPPATGTVNVAPVNTDGSLPSSYYCTVTLTAADNGSGNCDVASGVSDATCSWTPKASGSYKVTAVYSGDDLNLTSASTAVAITVP